MLFAVYLLLFLLFILGISKKYLRSRSKKNITRVIKNGPKSLYEYLSVCPDACPCCGSRDWVKVFWKISSTDNLSVSEDLHAYSQCVYCNYIQDFYGLESARGVGKWYLEVGRKHYRVSSRLLSKEQEKLIPDWNWNGAADNLDRDERTEPRLQFPPETRGKKQFTGHP